MSGSNIKEIKERVLRRIKPLDEDYKRIWAKIDEVLAKLKVIKNAKPTVQGSIAKDTWLKGDTDVDIFLIYEDPSVDFEEELNKIEAALGGVWVRKYAQHPYLWGTVDGIKFNIVPCYSIKVIGKKLSAVDRTPLHTEFVKRYSHLVDEIRIFKAFMKAMGLYGSEIKTQGFSGYLCELLVIHYGSFEKVLKSALRWHKKFVIDLSKSYKSFDEVRTKFNSPLIVIDPVDPERNCAAAVSERKFYEFIAAAELFLNNPSISFFEKPRFSLSFEKFISHFKERNELLVAYLADRPKIVDDILWGELRKATKIVKALLHDVFIEVVDAIPLANEDKICLVFAIKRSNIIIRKGPPLGSQNTIKFIDKYISDSRRILGPFIKDGFWYVGLKRNEEELIELLKSRKNVFEKTGIPKHLRKPLRDAQLLYKDSDLRTVFELFPEELSYFSTNKSPWVIAFERSLAANIKEET